MESSRGAIVGFLIVAYGISWSSYSLRAVADWPVWLDQTLRMVTKYGPTLAGLIMALVVARWQGVVSLMRRLFDIRVNPAWFLFALFMPPAMLLLALPIRGAFGGGVLTELDLELPAGLSLFSALLATRFFAGGGLGEELGWRGFMLPRVQSQVGALKASLLVGLAHGAWHLPAYGVAGAILLSIYTTAGAVVLTWMYNRTRGNLLLPALMHASGNASLSFVEVVFPHLNDDIPFVLIVFALWVVGATLLAWRSNLDPRRGHPAQS